mmetsp:Transcript_6019/g.5748  ORF Transcript_6019/g.5748 Transcript_6019/m.5748 type:complete len:82 (+) Transcript_6019:95-340(+)
MISSTMRSTIYELSRSARPTNKMSKLTKITEPISGRSTISPLPKQLPPIQAACHDLFDLLYRSVASHWVERQRKVAKSRTH